MLKLTINTTLTVSTLREYTTDVVWFTNYNGGASLNALSVDEDPTDLQAIKVGLTSQDFGNFAMDIDALQQALNTSEPITVISVDDNIATIDGSKSLDVYRDNY